MASREPPSQATCQSSFEQGVALALHLWPALTLAVQSNWGGSDSEDKRAWFAGAIVDLFPDLGSKPAAAPNPTPKPTITIATQQQQPKPTTTAGTVPDDGDDGEPDALDVETVLLQVMLDEFEVNVDDDSAYEVAEQIVRVRAECARGRFDGELAGLQRRFDARGGAKVVGVFKKGEDEDAETDWDTDDEDEEDEGDSDDGDVPMGDAPPKKEKEEPEVDDEGFTKVSRRKR
ncbi:Pre-rRNA-processing protein TSR2-domain-containing protein [Schizothecium vesticola]|uniref:Pre-rRNA-processing protein TSR2-domain-containing protein n=1 Tax=Schizothecium vesticola TaxID=314040 RepID=A0AA40EPX2_9PEZI|nr:Pre-rRNA-processing protein TSR2-domain-containing protein [Schizothecium vesticola]